MTMALTSRKRKRELQEVNKLEEEKNCMNPVENQHGANTNNTNSEEFDPNLSLDSCSPRITQKKEQLHSLLPNDTSDSTVLSLSSQRNPIARRSFEGDWVCEDTKRVSGSESRQNSAPADSVRSASPTCHGKSGIQKKLIIKRPAKHVVEANIVKQEEQRKNVPEQDIILKDMFEDQMRRNQGKNGVQSQPKNPEIVSPMQTSDDSVGLHKKELQGERQLVPCTTEDLNCNLEKDSSGDSDEDLPAVLGSSQEGKPAIQKNELVWAKFKKFPHWPAVVKNLYYKKKRLCKVVFNCVGEMFDGDRNRTLKLSYRPGAILPFGGKEHKQLKEKGLESPFSEYFKAAVEHTEDFMMRRAMEPNLNIWEFMKCDIFSGITTSAAGRERPAGDEYGNDEKMDSILPTDDNEDEMEQSDGTLSTVDEDDEDGEDDEVADEQEAPAASSTEVPEELKIAQEKRMERNKRFLEFMRSKQMLEHLCKVKAGECDSEFHKQFLENEKKASLNCIFGPIVEDDQQDEVMEILREIYKKAYNADQRALLENREYLLSVWVPEAVLFSIMKVQKLGRERALKVLINGPHLTQAENQQRHIDIISAATDLTRQEIKNNELKYKRMLKKLKTSKRSFATKQT